MQLRRLSESKVLQFAFFGAASALLLTVPTMSASYFLTNDLAVDVAKVTTLLLVLVILEHLFRLFSGVIIQNSHLAWGKYRSWIVVFRWPIATGSLLMFIRTGNLPASFRIVVFALAYLAVMVPLALTKTAHYMLIVKLAPTDMKERYRLSVRNTQLIMLVPLFSSYILAPMALMLFESHSDIQPAIFQNVLHVLLFLLGAFVLTRVSRPYDPPAHIESSVTPKQSVSEIFRAVFSNISLLSVLIANLLLYLAIAVSGGSIAYYYVSVVGDTTLLPITLTVSLFTGAVASLIVPYLGIVLKKKKAMVFGLLIYAVLSAATIFLARSSAIIFIVLVSLKTAILFLFQGFQVLYLLDSGECNLWKTGNDNRAVFVSLIDFPVKFGLALGALITAKVTSSVEFSSTLDSQLDAAGNFMMQYGGIPALCTLIGALILYFGYQISEEDAEKYIRENAEISVPLTSDTQ